MIVRCKQQDQPQDQPQDVLYRDADDPEEEQWQDTL